MGWWTQRIAEGKRSREEQELRHEVARLEPFTKSLKHLTALGHLYERLDEPDAALETYRRALTLNRESEGPVWQELQLKSRIAACEGGTSASPSLEIEQNGRTTRVYGSVCVLGRGSRIADLIVPSGTVAHQHCALWFEEGAWWVRDLGSTNGTTLNGVELVGAAKIESRAELRLAERTVLVRILNDPR